jgi:type IV secretory pathway component VirB8
LVHGLFDKGSFTQVLVLAVIGIWAIVPLKKYVYEEEK